MDFAVLLLAVIVKKFVDFIRSLAHGDINGIVTPIIAWLVGILVIYLCIWTMNWPSQYLPTDWSRILWGVFLGSAAGTIHDFLAATSRGYTRRRFVEQSPVAPVTTTV